MYSTSVSVTMILCLLPSLSLDFHNNKTNANHLLSSSSKEILCAVE